ncbi:MAG: FAD-binding oxidoreductase [Armatimonadetes bacterium]|nr:FAD-binding oxidoreductase [Armatimonadota bacterium]
MLTADVVVIGGGSTGTSVAFQLARRGAGRVVLVERGAIGSGPTSKSMGIIRLHYSYEPLIRLALRSLELFSHFEDLSGGTADFTRAGFLLAASSAQMPSLLDNVALQQRLGVRTSVLTPAQLKDLDPRLEVSDLGGAAYEPESGFADGYATASSFASAARRMGAKILEQTTVERIVVEGGHVQAVVTSGDTISTPRTLVAAGPWPPSVLEPLGIRVPIESSREQVVQFAPPPEFGRLEVVIEDLAQGFFARPEAGGTVLSGVLEEGAEEIVQPDGFNQGVDFDYVERVGRMWAHRYPSAADAQVRGGYASLYDVTPDWQPALGPVDGIEGLVIAAGFSGHGFKLSPALGEVLTAILLGERPAVDISMFALSRFATGALIHGRHAQGILG